MPIFSRRRNSRFNLSNFEIAFRSRWFDPELEEHSPTSSRYSRGGGNLDPGCRWPGHLKWNAATPATGIPALRSQTPPEPLP